MARDGFQDSERIEALKTLRGQLQQVIPWPTSTT